MELIAKFISSAILQLYNGVINEFSKVQNQGNDLNQVCIVKNVGNKRVWTAIESLK